MKNSVFVALLFSFSVMSCYQDKKKDCPAFDPTFMFSWFPYDTVGSRFVFVNSNGDRDIFASESVLCGTAYEISTKHPCDVWGYISMQKVGTQDSFMHTWMGIKYINEWGNVRNRCVFSFGSFEVAINVENFDMAKIAPGYDDYVYEQYSSYNFHNRDYNKVVVMTRKNMSDNALYLIDRVYFGKGYGVIGYRIYPSGMEFWLE